MEMILDNPNYENMKATQEQKTNFNANWCDSKGKCVDHNLTIFKVGLYMQDKALRWRHS